MTWGVPSVFGWELASWRTWGGCFKTGATLEGMAGSETAGSEAVGSEAAVSEAVRGLGGGAHARRRRSRRRRR
jgi:hypothetical protein